MKRLSAFRTVKILFLMLAIIFLILLYFTTNTYMNVMDAKVNIPRNIWVEDVIIPGIEDESKDAKISIVFNITNPTNIDIYVYNIEYRLYMDDLSDPMDFDRSDTWDKWAVGLGGFSYGAEEYYIKVPSKSHKSIYANMTVLGNTTFMDNLNVTDIDGKYHPLIIATVRYTFKDLDVKEVTPSIYYYSELGISPKSLEE